jgi:uncharacterized peroxidase-related enzyme
MKLPEVEKGTSVGSKLKLAAIRLVSGERVVDLVRLFMYRPKFFGTPVNSYIQALLRGPSEWTLGERELFAAYVSHCNGCEFCYAGHRAVANRAMGEKIVDAVFRDYRSANVTPQVKAVLAFLERLSKEPERITSADAEEVLSAGVTESGLEVAIHIATVFTVINRAADALGFEVPSASGILKSAEFLLKHGYKSY